MDSGVLFHTLHVRMTNSQRHKKTMLIVIHFSVAKWYIIYIPNLKILLYFESAWYVNFWFGRCEKFGRLYIWYIFVRGFSWDFKSNY